MHRSCSGQERRWLVHPAWVLALSEASTDAVVLLSISAENGRTESGWSRGGGPCRDLCSVVHGFMWWDKIARPFFLVVSLSHPVATVPVLQRKSWGLCLVLGLALSLHGGCVDLDLEPGAGAERESNGFARSLAVGAD